MNCLGGYGTNGWMKLNGKKDRQRRRNGREDEEEIEAVDGKGMLFTSLLRLGERKILPSFLTALKTSLTRHGSSSLSKRLPSSKSLGSWKSNHEDCCW